MIIVNGQIREVKKQGGGIDSVTRQPVAPRTFLGSPVPCQYIVKNNYQGKDANGNARYVASYEVYVKGEYKDGESVRIEGKDGRLVLDNGAILSSEYLRAVDETRLIIA